jgi:hypothetical protein
MELIGIVVCLLLGGFLILWGFLVVRACALFGQRITDIIGGLIILVIGFAIFWLGISHITFQLK